MVLELPIPTLDTLIDLENRLIRILRSDKENNGLCFRYGDLCSLDTIQVDVAPEKKVLNVFFIYKQNFNENNILFFRCYYTTF